MLVRVEQVSFVLDEESAFEHLLSCAIRLHKRRLGTDREKR
jgi:hypothetical protein